MGDIADMMLEGDLCAGCGAYLDGDSYGIPRYCDSDCEPEDYKKAKKELNRPEKESCPICKKKCNGKQGVKAHMGQLHGNETIITLKERSNTDGEDIWVANVYIKGESFESISYSLERVMAEVSERIYENS